MYIMNFTDFTNFVNPGAGRLFFFLDTHRLISDIKAAIDDCRGFANCYLLEDRQLKMYTRSMMFSFRR